MKAKSMGKTIISLLWAVTLTACNNIVVPPTIKSTNFPETPISIIETENVLVSTANPTATYPPTVVQTQFLTKVPPTPTNIPLGTYTDKIDYAMATSQPIYLLFPHVLDANFYSGEYTGCIQTNDFQTLILYEITLPLETVKFSFANYFQTENWQGLEEIANDNTSTTIYEVSRITVKDIPVSERLKVILLDESARFGKSHIFVRIELTHIETKENNDYLSLPYGAICQSTTPWHWIRLSRN